MSQRASGMCGQPAKAGGGERGFVAFVHLHCLVPEKEKKTCHKCCPTKAPPPTPKRAASLLGPVLLLQIVCTAQLSSWRALGPPTDLAQGAGQRPSRGAAGVVRRCRAPAESRRGLGLAQGAPLLVGKSPAPQRWLWSLCFWQAGSRQQLESGVCAKEQKVGRKEKWSVQKSRQEWSSFPPPGNPCGEVHMFPN